MTFDPNKPVQTRDGKKVRIVATDLKGGLGETICALVTCNNGEIPISYYHEGRYLNTHTLTEHQWDLVNIPEEKVSRVLFFPAIEVKGVWVNVTTVGNKVVKLEME